MFKTRPVLLIAGDTSLVPKLMARYSVRVLTCDADEAARLRGLGVDVIHGDLADVASIRTATKDCYAVVGVVDGPEQGRNLIKVVAGADVEQFVLHAREGREELDQYANALGIHSEEMS